MPAANYWRAIVAYVKWKTLQIWTFILNCARNRLIFILENLNTFEEYYVVQWNIN